MHLPLLFGLNSQGNPVTVRCRSGLRDSADNPAHAATFICQRLIVLDPELKADPAQYQHILLYGKATWEKNEPVALVAKPAGLPSGARKNFRTPTRTSAHDAGANIAAKASAIQQPGCIRAMIPR